MVGADQAGVALRLGHPALVQGGTPVGAHVAQAVHLALRVAEQHQVLPQQLDAHRRLAHLLRKGCRHPRLWSAGLHGAVSARAAAQGLLFS